MSTTRNADPAKTSHLTVLPGAYAVLSGMVRLAGTA
jgi:hypothetical protein